MCRRTLKSLVLIVNSQVWKLCVQQHTSVETLCTATCKCGNFVYSNMQVSKSQRINKLPRKMVPQVQIKVKLKAQTKQNKTK